MKQVVIENPIINSLFDAPNRHFRFTDEGITDEIIGGRRISSYFVPIARPKKRGAKHGELFEVDGPQERRENELINKIRSAGVCGVKPSRLQ